MFMRFSSTVLLWICLIQVVSAADVVGFRETTLDQTSPRPLHVSVWYPAVSSQTHIVEKIGEDQVFVGIDGARNAQAASGTYPLVVLSHGFRGSWRNVNWLAAELVKQGYIVAAPDHPGTTTHDRNPAQAQQLWQRPKDVSRVIDALIATPSITGHIDQTRIAAIGHSLGGWTVVELAGARFDTQQFVQDCQHGVNPRICGLTAEFGINKSPEFVAQLDADLRDPRVKAVVSLDLGVARGFTSQSLAAVNVPVLVLAAGVDIADLPAELESGYLVAGLPKASTRYVLINDATHFSFMQLCKPGAVALLEEDSPDDGVVCKDGNGRDRQAIHQQISTLIIAFLKQVIPAH